MSIAENLQQVNARIHSAEMQYNRIPDSVTLLAVSKTHSIDKIKMAYEAGQIRFGENYVQEAIEKIQLLAQLNLEWHFIGHIQSNKTQAIADNFSWVHSVDHLHIAQRLAKQRSAQLPPLNICLQVNASNEETKSGANFAELTQLALAIAEIPNIRLRGLMAIPAPHSGREPYRRLYDAYNNLKNLGLPLDTLSMGMSADLEDAIAEGATLVRVGADIFGQR